LSDNDNERELLVAALSETARGMSADEWNVFVAQTRPTDYKAFTDPADRRRAVAADITAKQLAAKQRPAQPQLTQADRDALSAQIKAAEESGDHTRAIALKQCLRPKVDANGYPLREGTTS